MRPVDEIEKRWSLLFNTSIGVDLRQAIQQDDGGFDPCEDGLRSVCWRSYLLHGPLSKGSWTKKLSESRSGYTSLRDHFLRYINNPNDVHSSADPLTDDETSPWSTLRNDEEIREEIMRDVGRCYQDNFFFKEPETQRKLLDILFIYAKLNPDTGYRQGMHELLAPVLWVVSQDSLDTKVVPENVLAKEGADLMVDCLDQKYVEHDSFSLFCAIMQTAKSFYTLGESRDSSAIVAQSERIHNELLNSVDPDLALHLQTIGMLPQIYCLPWIRLLMGRIFELNSLLKLWDALFAERLSLDIVDWTCVALLLRVRWQLIEADYGTAISLLTRFSLPPDSDSPRSVVKDALLLSRNKSCEAGAQLVEKYSGRRPRVARPSSEPLLGSTPPQNRVTRRPWPQHASPSLSPARFSTPQKQLENLFSDVQRRTEGWNVGSVSKALRGAVGEVRRNVNNLQYPHSRESSIDAGYDPLGARSSVIDQTKALEARIQTLEQRNKVLAKMLDTAMESLRTCKPGNKEEIPKNEDVLNTSLAKIQFVSVYLSDPDIQLSAEAMNESEDHLATPRKPLQQSPDKPESNINNMEKQTAPAMPPSLSSEPDEPKENASAAQRAPPTSPPTIPTVSNTGPSLSLPHLNPEMNSSKTTTTSSPPTSTTTTPSRPSLADSSFSFMLGNESKRSSFVRSVQHRDSEAQMKFHNEHISGASSTGSPKQQPGKDGRSSISNSNSSGFKTGAGKGRRGSGVAKEVGGGPLGGDDEEGEDGFTMSSLRGGR